MLRVSASMGSTSQQNQPAIMTFCFDTTRGEDEGQEFEKIIYFYPPTTPPNTQKARMPCHSVKRTRTKKGR